MVKRCDVELNIQSFKNRFAFSSAKQYVKKTEYILLSANIWRDTFDFFKPIKPGTHIVAIIVKK